MSLKELYRNKWARFGFWAVLYILWVIWLGNYWWLFGLIPIFDGHITRKVKWTFWKKEYKEGEKRNVLLDWLDAIIFAVIVVTFINTFFFQAFKIPSSSMESSTSTRRPRPTMSATMVATSRRPMPRLSRSVSTPLRATMAVAMDDRF
jgi:signal peptidase I